MAQRAGETLFFQSPSYFDHLAHRPDGCALSLAVALDDSGATIGVVPLWQTETRLNFRARDFTFGELGFRCLRILGGNLLLPDERDLFELLFETLSSAFPDCSLIEINGLPTSSALWKFLGTAPGIAKDFRVYAPHGPRLCQWTDVPATFDQYLARFRRKKRYNLRRQLRMLDEHAGGTLALRRIETPDEVPVLAGALERLARRKLRNDGRAMTTSELVDLAARGLLLSYVLSMESGPCSLALGTRFRDVQLVHMLAHDRAIDHLSPGTALHLLMMKDLIEASLARRLDYGYGEPKYRLANNVEERASVMLVRKTFLNSATIKAHATFNQLVEILKEGLVGARIAVKMLR